MKKRQFHVGEPAKMIGERIWHTIVFILKFYTF